MSPRTDRQPRQRLDAQTRRAEILGAAAQAFATQPYAAVQVGAVAEAAGASEALVYRYFGTKAALYTEVVQESLDALLARQVAADAELPPGVPVRDRIRRSLEIYLDFVAQTATGWSAALRSDGGDPVAAVDVRRAFRARNVALLRDLLGPAHHWPRGDYSLWGYLGFVDYACLAWVARGCPVEDRWPVIEASLGALEGALGDWAG